jgi:uncharacterized protein (TIRG00374 family)
MGKIKLLVLLIAAASLVWMFQVVGWPEIIGHLKLVGWYWPLILLPYLLVNLCDAASWYCCFERFPPGVTIGHLFFNRLAGEAVNVLTPMASLGGEPVKAVMLQQRGIALTDATASLVISKGVLVLSLAFYILLGLAAAPFLFHLSTGRWWALAAAALALGLGAVIFVVVQRYGMCRLGMAVMTRCRFLPRRLQEHEAALCRLDAQMSTFYRQHLWRFWLALGLSLLGWLLHGLEVYIIFDLLGQPIHLLTALCLDALATLISSMAFFIPGNLGVQDGGNILLAIGMQLGALMGATFSLIRRLREGFWLAVGLVVLAVDR